MREGNRRFAVVLDGFTGAAAATAKGVIELIAGASQPIRVEEMLLSSTEVNSNNIVRVEWALNHASDVWVTTNTPLALTPGGPAFAGTAKSNASTTTAVVAGTIYHLEEMRFGTVLHRYFGHNLIIQPGTGRRLIVTTPAGGVASATWHVGVIFSIGR